MAEFLANNQDPTICSMIWYYLKNTISDFGGVNRWICKVDNGFLVDIVETKNIRIQNWNIGYDSNNQWFALSSDELVSMNFFWFMPSIFDYIQEWFKEFLLHHGHELTSEYYIPTILDTLIKWSLAQCKVLPNNASWFGVTYPEDKPYVVNSLQKLIATGEYPSSLWN
jgi:hypothetical protein